MLTLFEGTNVVSITASDLARAKAFYSDQLGLGAPAYAMPEIGWYVILSRPQRSRGDNRPTLDYTTEDY